MSNIMNTNWDKEYIRDIVIKEPVDEGAAGTAAKLGLAAGVGAGIYGGIKDHRLEKIDREEKALRWYRFKKNLTNQRRENKVRQREIKHAKQDAELAKYRKMERDYNNDRDPENDGIIDKAVDKINDTKNSIKRKLKSHNESAIDDITNEDAVGKAVGLGLLGLTTYGAAKGIVRPIVKDIADKKERNEYEHERAFRETPKETVRRITNKVKRKRVDESASEDPSSNVLSKVW